jgi:hypothetical protein
MVPFLFCTMAQKYTTNLQNIPDQRDSSIKIQTVYTATSQNNFLRVVTTNWFQHILLRIGQF